MPAGVVKSKLMRRWTQPWPIVAVEGGRVVVLGHERGEGAEVDAEPGGRDGGVFPAFEALGLAGDDGDGAEGGLADEPDLAGFGFGEDADGGRDGEVGGGCGESGGEGDGVGFGVCAEFGEEEAVAGGEELDAFGGEVLALGVVEQETVEAFEGDGVVGEDEGDGVGGDEGVGEAEADDGAELRALDEAQAWTRGW